MEDKKTLLPIAVLVPLYLVLITGVPFVAAAAPVVLAETPASRLICLFACPFVYALSYLFIAAVLAAPLKGYIVPGKFPRRLDHFVYGPRRLYGLCWGAIYYFTPLYYGLLTIPILRKALLWLFGYRGHPEVTIAPDAWIRDLPLLKMSEGAYVANKATVGTNICLSNGSILVDSISIGAQAMIGHLCMLAPGAQIGDHVEIGVGCAIGIRTKIGEKARIGGTSTVGHGARIGANADIGPMSYIGLKASIADGLQIPSAATVPEGAVLRTQEDVQSCLSSETRLLHVERTRLEELYASREKGTEKTGVANIAVLSRVGE